MSGVDFHPVAKDTAKSMMKVVDYILSLPISKKDKITRLAKTFNLIGSDFYIQMFNASSELFDSTAIGTTDYNKMTEQVNRLSCKLVQNYNLKRGSRQLVQDFYDSALGKAQSEAFKHVSGVSLWPEHILIQQKTCLGVIGSVTVFLQLVAIKVETEYLQIIIKLIFVIIKKLKIG